MADTSSKSNYAEQLKERLRKLKEDKMKTTEQPEEDMWSQFRDEEDNEERGHVMPGGVDVGKRNENILAKIKSTNGGNSGAELRNTLTKFFNK